MTGIIMELTWLISVIFSPSWRQPQPRRDLFVERKDVGRTTNKMNENSKKIGLISQTVKKKLSSYFHRAAFVKGSINKRKRHKMEQSVQSLSLTTHVLSHFIVGRFLCNLGK